MNPTLQNDTDSNGCGGDTAAYPPREPVDLDDVADMLSCIVDGAIIMSKTLNDPSRLERQIMIFGSCIKLMFAPAPMP